MGLKILRYFYHHRRDAGLLFGPIAILLGFVSVTLLASLIIGVPAAYILGYNNKIYDFVFFIFQGYWGWNWETIQWISVIGMMSLAFVIFCAFIVSPIVYILLLIIKDLLFYKKELNTNSSYKLFSLDQNPPHKIHVILTIILTLIIIILGFPCLGHVSFIWSIGDSHSQYWFSGIYYLQGMLNYIILMVCIITFLAIFSLIILSLISCVKCYRDYQKFDVTLNQDDESTSLIRK